VACQVGHAVIGADDDGASTVGALVAEGLPERRVRADRLQDAVELLGHLDTLVVDVEGLGDGRGGGRDRRRPEGVDLLLVFLGGQRREREGLRFRFRRRRELFVLLARLHLDVPALAGHLVGNGLDDARPEVRAAPASLRGDVGD
jgi:hypothetical protein